MGKSNPATAITPTNKSITNRLFRPVDGASLAVVRFVFGFFVAVDAWRYLAYGWVRTYYVDPPIHFTYLYLDFVRPWPGDGMFVHFVVLSLLALATALGLFYRWTAPLLFAAYLYVFLLEQSVYMNHHYLMVLLALLLACMPAHRVASLDRLRRPAMPQTVPFWCVGLLRFQLALVYFYGAIAKLNPDWLAGEPMLSSIRDGSEHVPAIAAWLPPEVIASFIAFAGIAIDIALPVLLLWTPLRWLGFVLAVAFHGLNAIFLHIGVFSYLMIGAVSIFFAPDWPRRGLPPMASADAPVRPNKVVLSLLAVYVGLQVLLPLRHWLYPGDVAWTEEGHRFAWRMKLRGKSSEQTIRARDLRSGETWVIDPQLDLTARQRAKLETFPDILLQYVHHHRDRLQAAGVPEPRIFVDWRCSLNGAPLQPLVDPNVDLARVERSWRPATWLLPRPAEPTS